VNPHKIVLLISAAILLLGPAVFASAADGEGPADTAVQPAEAGSPLSSAAARFNELNTLIRDGKIGRSAARAELNRILAEVGEAYRRAGGRDCARSEWVFPLAGYDSRAISGGRRHGYIARGYDFYRGNRHGGHPSFDIFIRDRNRDSRDDRSGRPVRVLSMTGGVVVALEREWEQGSRLRGGRYLWIYDPSSHLLVYYAHNGDLSVTLGDVVKPGDQLASVGRSGWNAAKRRSPTHLHLTAVTVAGDGMIVPENIYPELKVARCVPAL
jgi:peptidoglycan LD-endopeptidase LytH